MLKKIRIRFISVSLVLICIVMLVISISVCLYVYFFHMNLLDHALDTGILYVKTYGNNNIQERDINLARNNIFAITVSDSKYSTKPYEELYGKLPERISDWSEFEKIIKAAKDGTASGDFHNLHLKYKKTYYTSEKFSGFIIAFADEENAHNTIVKTIILAIVVFISSAFFFFIILIWLSAFVVKPIDVAWTQQQQFIADASHELKTPLSAILANNLILKKHLQNNQPEELKWLENSQAEAKHMKDLIDNLLFLAKPENSDENINFEPVSLSDLITEIILQMEPISFESGITLSSEIEDDITVLGDIVQLRQLAYILFDNAYKYCGEKGEISIFLKKNTLPVLTVNNNGDPIPKEDLPNIFERFYRSDKSRSRQSRSDAYGLGLAIAQKIAARHDATIKVTSDFASGTTFSVTFNSIRK